MDYKALLMKYMGHIYHEEGGVHLTFLNNEFTLEEKDELRKMWGDYCDEHGL